MLERLATWTLLTIICAVAGFSAVQSEKPVELPEGDGKKILETSCSGCHAVAQVVKDTGFGKEDWQKLVERMVQYGADLKSDQVHVLADYLATNFGEGRKILDTACTACHSLDEVKKFRDFFKKNDWQDVVTTMVKYGADVKEAQVPVLVEYLATTYSSQK